MAKHLPPPKNKHLSQSRSKHTAPKTGSKERDILNERSFSPIPLISCALSAVLIIILRRFSLAGWLRTAVYLLPFICAGAGLVKRLADKLRERDFYEEDIIILAAALITYCLGRFTVASAVLILYRVGDTAANFIVSRCRADMDDFAGLRSRNANVLRNGQVCTLSPDKVKIGDILIVSRGEIIPLDGEVTEGISTLDTSPISGSREYMNVSPGSPVLSGCRNNGSDLKIKVTRSCEDSACTIILNNLMDVNRRKAKAELFPGGYTCRAASAI